MQKLYRGDLSHEAVLERKDRILREKKAWIVIIAGIVEAIRIGEFTSMFVSLLPLS